MKSRFHRNINDLKVARRLALRLLPGRAHETATMNLRGCLKVVAAALRTLAMGLLMSAGVFGWAAEARSRDDARADKLATPLLEETAFLKSHPAYDYDLPVIVRLRPDALSRISRADRASAPGRRLGLIGSYALTVRGSRIGDLAASEEVEYVTLDAPLRAFSDELRAIGADKAQAPQSLAVLNSTLFLVSPGFSGAGVGVAVFDSGIRVNHPDLSGRVEKRVDFTSGRAKIGSSAIDDDNGHGTYVAGIIGSSHSVYKGVAPAANLISVKVVDSLGIGRTSNLILAIEWVIANKNSYNIRVANLSVGHPPVESYLNDPLCQAVAAMVEAGIVTVASAGNLGKLPGYSQIWGAINSPANHPSVIAVGAVNTRGTAIHSDDLAATFSSRGPSYQDGMFKPELVAPGNAIVSSAASNTTLTNVFPWLMPDANHIRLSGSSAAAAFVSGTAALMMQANPTLTTRLAKLILLASAAKLRNPFMLEQGNGLVNAYTAVRLAASLDTYHRTLKYEVPVSWTLDGEIVQAGGAFAAGHSIVYPSTGIVGAAWGNGAAWNSPVGNAGWLTTLFGSTSLVWSADFADETAFWQGGSNWTGTTTGDDAIFWTEGMMWTDGILWTEGFFGVNGVFWADYVAPTFVPAGD